MEAWRAAWQTSFLPFSRDRAHRGHASIRPPNGRYPYRGSLKPAASQGSRLPGQRSPAFLPSLDPTFTDFLQGLSRILATSLLDGGMVRSPRAQVSSAQLPNHIACGMRLSHGMSSFYFCCDAGSAWCGHASSLLRIRRWEWRQSADSSGHAGWIHRKSRHRHPAPVVNR